MTGNITSEELFQRVEYIATAHDVTMSQRLRILHETLVLTCAAGLSDLSFSVGAFSFPLEDMYSPIAIFAYILPVRYYFLIYVDQALNGFPLYYSRLYYAALLAFLLLPALVLKRMKKANMNPVYVP